MVDMKSPGITVKPLRQMHGGQDFNEVFFANVRVPRQNLIGGLNDGWRVSTTTLANERGTNALSQYVRYEQIFNDLVRLARASCCNGRGALQDAVVRQELARHYVDLQGFKYNCFRVFSAITNGGSPGGEGSILKLLWSELTNACRRPRWRWKQRRASSRRTRRARWKPDAGRFLPALARQHDRSGHFRDPAQYYRAARAGPSQDQLAYARRASASRKNL